MSIQKTNSLIAKGLHKKYGSRMVVNNVDISVSRNEIVGLLKWDRGGMNSERTWVVVSRFQKKNSPSYILR